MSFFSSWIKVIFITASVFPFYSEASIAALRRKPPDCDKFKDELHICTREMDPICGTNRHTYSNACVFCTEMLKNNKAFEFGRYGGSCDSS